MPVAVENGEELAGIDAFDALLERLNAASFSKEVGAKEADINFLSDFMNDPIVQALVEAQDTLEDSNLEPVSCDNIELVKEIVDELNEKSGSPAARELRNLLCQSDFKALIESHDDIAAKNYEDEPEVVPIFQPAPETFGSPQDAIRMVGIRKNEGESLGITISLGPAKELVIERILADKLVHRQGLLHVGDVIKEINGQEVVDPDQLSELMRKSAGSITLKIIPSHWDQNPRSQVFLKALFSYDPRRDNLVPCRDAALAFKEGDILQVVNREDPNWWQAKKVDQNGASGLIPSQNLEEKRKAFVKPEYDYTHKSLLCGLMTKKKRKMMYQAGKSSDFDRSDVQVYEEVARMPPFQRKTLVIIGAQGVGRRSLKERLIRSDSSRFGGVIPHTSRPMRPGEKDGDAYFFVPRDRMEMDISKNKYLECGEFDGSFYGTRFDSVRQVIRSSKMCILDLNPQALKSVKTSEFMPYVVFLAAPPVDIMRNMHEFARMRGKTDKYKTERDFRATLDESAKIERHYKGFFDLTIVNDNFDETFNKLRKAIETLSAEPQWVPVSWVY